MVAVFRQGGELQAHAALVGKLDGIAYQVDEYRGELGLVAVDQQARGRRRFHPPGEALLLAAQPEHRVQTLRHSQQIEIDRVQFQGAGLDPGEIQDLVDQCQEVVAALLDGVHGPALSRGSFRVAPQDLSIAQDGVEWSADLVAHVGQEPALGLVGLICLFPGLGQLHLLGFQGLIGQRQPPVSLEHARRLPRDEQHSDAQGGEQPDPPIGQVHRQCHRRRTRRVDQVPVYGLHLEKVGPSRKILVLYAVLVGGLPVLIITPQSIAIDHRFRTRFETDPPEHKDRHPYRGGNLELRYPFVAPVGHHRVDENRRW